MKSFSFDQHRTNRSTGEQAASGAQRRGGFALLLCLFIIFMVSTWVVGMLSSQTIHFAALRNTIDYERALYLANGGIHHATALLEDDTDWRGTVTGGSYPASGSYSATAADGASSQVVITSTGVAGEVTRKLQATVSVP
jgi:hypothetical protein